MKPKTKKIIRMVVALVLAFSLLTSIAVECNAFTVLAAMFVVGATLVASGVHLSCVDLRKQQVKQNTQTNIKYNLSTYEHLYIRTQDKATDYKVEIRIDDSDVDPEQSFNVNCYAVSGSNAYKEFSKNAGDYEDSTYGWLINSKTKKLYGSSSKRNCLTLTKNTIYEFYITPRNPDGTSFEHITLFLTGAYITDKSGKNISDVQQNGKDTTYCNKYEPESCGNYKEFSASEIEKINNVSFKEIKINEITGYAISVSASMKNKSKLYLSSYGMEVYNSSGNCVSRIKKSGSSSSSISFKETASGLKPNTTYYATVFANSSYGTFCSDTFSFKTPKVKPSKTSISSAKTIDYRNKAELNSSEVGIGDNVSIKWKAADYAEWYTISVNGKEQGGKITGTSKIMNFDGAGAKEIRVRAHNSVGSSDWSEPVTVTVHPNVNVIFHKGENIYQQQCITWNHDFTSMPEIPAQKGNAFAGWYLEDMTTFASFNNIKQDFNIYAKFVPSSYVVKFVDPKGTLIKSEKVNFGTAATAPAESEFASSIESGRRFIGWNKDFSNVTSAMTVTAVTDAQNQDIPVEITNVSAVRYEKNYVVTCTVNNLTRADIENGRIITALKTEEGKLVTTNESAAFFLDKNYNDISGELVTNSENVKIVIPVINKKSTDGSEVETVTATVAEVYAIKDYQTTVPISSNISVNVVDRDPWTSWTLIKDDSYSAENTDTLVQYHSRELQKTTTTNESEKNRLIEEGWTLYNTVVSKDTNSGTWSKTKPSTGTAGVDYATKTVTDKAASTTYKYKRYKYYNSSDGNYWFSYGSGWATNHGYSGTWEYKTTTSPLSKTGSADGWNIYDKTWFSNSGDKTNPKVTTAAVTHTEYRVFNDVYTYYLNKWPEEFSDWTTAVLTETDNIDVESRTIYRYKKSDLVRVEDNSGVVRSDFASGNIGAEYAGKQVALIIYKINEASDWTTEHIAQTTVSADGSYHFDSYKLREEPSEITGDMTAVLGVEGAEDVIFLGKIEAPKPKYSVTFVDDITGEIISKQEVEEGSDAVVPNSPAHNGYSFSHWNNCSTNIQNNLEIRAEYSINTYTVVWIDYVQNRYEIKTYEHGQSLEPPFGLLETSEMIPDGWDGYTNDIVIPVTQSMVITAKYLYRTFTVDFLDYDMNVIESQTVRYGAIPEYPDISKYLDDNHFIFGFTSIEEEVTEGGEELQKASSDEGTESAGAVSESDDEFIALEAYEVYNDCRILPVFEYSKTAEAPTVSVATGSYASAQTVSMESATDKAVIYYTTDGSDPATSKTAKEYTAPVSISKSCKLRCYASAMSMNSSAETVAYYAIGSDHILNYAIGETISYTAIVANGSKIPADVLVDEEGYTFEGVYSDKEMKNKWNIASGTVTADTTLYLNYIAKEYTVDFLDYDGFYLDSQVVAYSESASEPEEPSRDGYVFIGWDSNEYLSVREDLEVTAMYVDENEYYAVSISDIDYTTMVGSTFTLSATASNKNGEEGSILWLSSDDSVAGVDENGTVYALESGTATIYAECAENGERAECIVTVCGNPAKEIMLKDSASVSIDANGYLRNIRLITDEEAGTHSAETVEVIKAQFSNSASNVKIYSKNGELLEETDPVSTGAVIRLYSNGEVTDEITVVVAGDLDGDGFVSNRDAAWLTRYLVKKETADNAQLTAMDVNGDGYVNNRDASVISRYLVGKEAI